MHEQPVKETLKTRNSERGGGGLLVPCKNSISVSPGITVPLDRVWHSIHSIEKKLKCPGSKLCGTLTQPGWTQQVPSLLSLVWNKRPIKRFFKEPASSSTILSTQAWNDGASTRLSECSIFCKLLGDQSFGLPQISSQLVFSLACFFGNIHDAFFFSLLQSCVGNPS